MAPLLSQRWLARERYQQARALQQEVWRCVRWWLATAGQVRTNLGVANSKPRTFYDSPHARDRQEGGHQLFCTLQLLVVAPCLLLTHDNTHAVRRDDRQHPQLPHSSCFKTKIQNAWEVSVPSNHRIRSNLATSLQKRYLACS